jgi:hypothetical protein
MNLIKTTTTLLTASLAAAMFAAPASAVPLPATASLAYDGTIDFTLSNGLSVVGALDAQYRTPTGPSRPYEFTTSLNFGEISITPVITVTTPEFELIPEICLPFLGCTPPVSLPGQEIGLTPSISLGGPFEIYDLSYTSGNIPLGPVFNFDFGTPLLGDALTIDDLVREQFETGEKTVSETGVVVGPLLVDYEYDGVLQPDGETILADYLLSASGPGFLGEFEALVLGIINENTDLLAELALEAIQGLGLCDDLGPAAGLCEDVLAGLDPSQIGISVDSIGNFSSTYSLKKAITAVPVPATLPLLALGVALVGLSSNRRRKITTA